MDLQIQIPEERRVISVKTSEAEELRNLIQKKGYTTCLETGLAFGQSACYMLSSDTLPTLTSVDPFQEVDYQSIGLKNIAANGFADRHTHIVELSEFALPKLVESGQKFDFIFIDGDHKFDGAFIDFFFASKLLNDGGTIVFHDMWMRSLILAKSYILKNRPDFKSVSLQSSNMAAFEKIGTDTRDGMVFSEFYTRKGYMKYHINRLAWENKGPLGKLINSLKKLIKG